MRAEDVPGEWVVSATKAYDADHSGYPVEESAMREAIAAVAPLIARAERERCAKVAMAEFPPAQSYSYDPGDEIGWAKADARTDAANDIAAAIRALGDRRWAMGRRGDE